MVGWWERGPRRGSAGDLDRGQRAESGQGRGTKITSPLPRGGGALGKEVAKQLLIESTRGRQGLGRRPQCPPASGLPWVGGGGRVHRGCWVAGRALGGEGSMSLNLEGLFYASGGGGLEERGAQLRAGACNLFLKGPHSQTLKTRCLYANYSVVPLRLPSRHTRYLDQRVALCQ